MFKYFIHRNSKEEIIGYDMGSEFVSSVDFERNPEIFTTEVTKEDFEKEVTLYKKESEISI